MIRQKVPFNKQHFLLNLFTCECLSSINMSQFMSFVLLQGVQKILFSVFAVWRWACALRLEPIAIVLLTLWLLAGVGVLAAVVLAAFSKSFLHK